jgi:hypothetical protein
MARISLKEDAKLTKKDLLRPSVVAWLLGVAPKTIHAWKDIQIKKVHGVKYLRWHDIRVKCSDSFQILDLPSDASDAYSMWVEKKPKAIVVKPDGSITKPVVSVANSALEKAKALLALKPKQIIPVVDKIEQQESNEIEEILGVSEEYKHLFKDEVVVLDDGCLECKHSRSKFHTKYGCKFAKGTIAECHCKKGN